MPKTNKEIAEEILDNYVADFSDDFRGNLIKHVVFALNQKDQQHQKQLGDIREGIENAKPITNGDFLIHKDVLIAFDSLTPERE